jgi:flagellar hook-length control protein FliK
MGIESIPVALLSSKPAVPMPSALQGTGQPATERPTEDKTSKEFRNLLNGLHAGAQNTTERMPPPAEGDLADVAADGKKSQKTSPLETPAAAPDAASVMAGYWVPVPVPVPVPQATPAASVPGVSDALGAATGSSEVVAQTAPMAEGVGLAGPVAGSGVPDARTQAVHLANYASVFEQIQSRLAASGGSGAVAAAAQDAAGSGLNSLVKPVLGTAVADSRAAQLASVAAGGTWTLPVTQASALQAATDTAEALALAVNTTGDKQEAVPTGQAPEGGVGQNHFTPTVHFESAAASVDMQQPAPEAAVADQVSYWISQGIQNAELTFNGADSEPVQVRISLSGNEAHVEFLTDQLETRDLLTGAASHLEDLLHSEGMVLSGLSVGSSGTGGGNDRERRSPSETRKNTAQPAPEVEAVRATAPRGPTGRTVDLFV